MPAQWLNCPDIQVPIPLSGWVLPLSGCVRAEPGGCPEPREVAEGKKREPRPVRPLALTPCTLLLLFI